LVQHDLNSWTVADIENLIARFLVDVKSECLKRAFRLHSRQIDTWFKTITDDLVDRVAELAFHEHPILSALRQIRERHVKTVPNMQLGCVPTRDVYQHAIYNTKS